MKSVMIDSKRLKELQKAQDKLIALESGGVDNWEGYDISLKDFWKENEVEELIEEFIEEVLEVCSLESEVEYPAGRECGHSILFKDGIKEILTGLINKFLTQRRELLED